MKVEQIACGGDRNYGYLIISEDNKKVIVVDPSPDPTFIVDEIEKNRYAVEMVINTHSHSDHTGGNQTFEEKYHCEIFVHEHTDSDHKKLKDNDMIPLGSEEIRILYTPGHTPDSICVLAGNNLITGDTLFVGKVGGTYSNEDARKEFDSLKRLMELDNEVKVWPGHNYGVRPVSTIMDERETNPFCVRLSDFESFIWLKSNWADYKQAYGIK